jgi:dihydroxyacetone kinase-like protein
MSTDLGTDRIRDMLRAAAAEVRAQHDRLTKLDSVIGDGDHGAAMLRAVKAVENTLDANSTKSLAELFTAIAWEVMAIDGGSTGPLLGSFFLGMADAAERIESIDTPALAELFAGAVEGMRMNTKAQVGDKTMMDALLPAADALSAAAERGQTPGDALRAAAAAAARGAEATTDMKAAYGRARNLGDRVLGHMDPGACSMALMFAGFARGLEDSAVQTAL